MMDQLCSSAQRQGRIPFFMSSLGEEAAIIGSAAAWKGTDEVWAQYREAGVLLWREAPLSLLFAQLFASKDDTGTGGTLVSLAVTGKNAWTHGMEQAGRWVATTAQRRTTSTPSARHSPPKSLKLPVGHSR